ncbi:MAG: transposase [Pseudomonadales bacterium]|nr:transposase [Pseudomonadales bacterium]
MNHAGYLPEFVTVTDGKTHSITAGREMNFPKGSIVVVEKAYNNFEWYNTLPDKGFFFVTRLKSNAKYRIIEHRDIMKSKGITSDQLIEFTGLQTAKKCPIQLRRMGYHDEKTGKH